MARKPAPPELGILYQALGATLGLVVRTDNPTMAKQRLYAARRKSGDPDLDRLQFLTSPDNPSGEIWIVKGGYHEQE
jgi:hypothetical protein